MAGSDAIAFRLPSKYASGAAARPPPADSSTEPSPASASDQPGAAAPAPAFSDPSLPWQLGTWSVTHSTLSMWRSARNVRITYKELPASKAGRLRIDDLVEYEPADKTGVVKGIAGVDTQAGPGEGGGWNWRGKGLLAVVGSHWELLAWGEDEVGEEKKEEEEKDRKRDGQMVKWLVVWFAPTAFTKEGIDLLCDRREGLSERVYRAIVEGLRTTARESVMAALVEEILPVEIKLPWVEK